MKLHIKVNIEDFMSFYFLSFDHMLQEEWKQEDNSENGTNRYEHNRRNKKK